MRTSRLLGPLAFTIVLAACSAESTLSATTATPSDAAKQSETAAPTRTPIPPTVTLTAAPPPPTPSPTASCPANQGEVLITELEHADLPRSLPYRIYLPPCVEQYRGELPTLYLLHGLARTDSQWHELKVDVAADLLIQLRMAQPFLIVMPWERLGLDYEPTIVEYLLPHIVSEYGGSPEPELRAIGGISRGGGWALHIGLAHPEQFGSVGLHSPAVLVPDLFNLPGWVEANSPPRLWIDIGDRDPLRFSALDLTELLDELEVPYEFHMFAGEHAASYWLPHVEQYLRWYVSNWD